EELSPHIAVFTNLFPDHQDYYEGMDDYLADKAEIFLHQGPDDTLVLGSAVAELIKEKYVGKAIVSNVVIADPNAIGESELGIPGMHNRANAACALAAAEAFGVSTDAAKKALASFTGVAGRLELIREKDGVRFYNDTTATTPEATLAALAALPETTGIVLIMGGSDKGLDMNALLLAVGNRAKRIILLPGTGTNRVLEFLTGASVYDTLEAAVAEAARSAESGDAVLLSPAFASFGMFKNEYDRGDQFNALVRAL
ncbi:MAG TPA: Mur ligase family protein, partial [Candidatus Paceibacterota bacterium]|nr:Mur ligase family protein [Candidatus Paceibacterota bacterium]